MLRNGSYAAKSIECSNYKQGRTFSLIKQVLNKIIQFLPCHVLVLSFGRILYHIEHFIEERCSYFSLSMDAPCFQDGHSNLLGPGRRSFSVKNRILAQLKSRLKRNMRKNLKQKRNSSKHERFPKAVCLQKFVMCAHVLEGGKTASAKRAHTRCTDARIIARYDRCAVFKS